MVQFFADNLYIFRQFNESLHNVLKLTEIAEFYEREVSHDISEMTRTFYKWIMCF